VPRIAQPAGATAASRGGSARRGAKLRQPAR